MKILYAEDELQLSAAVSEILKIEGFEVTSVYDGEEAWNELQKGYFDAVILDIMMPKLDGIGVLEKMRLSENFTPVLMLTAKTTVEDRIEGLSVGADDYLGKPFAMKELVARLNSMLRRSGQYRRSTLKSGNLTLDLSTGELTSDKSSLRLSNAEAELLALLMQAKGSAFSAEEINARLWNGKKGSDAAKLYVSYLKTKLHRISSSEQISETEEGYFILSA